MNIVRIPMPAVLRPEYSKVDTAINEYYAAYKDYESHEELLQLIARFKKQLSELELGARALAELSKEAAEKHPVDDHDAELLSALASPDCLDDTENAEPASSPGMVANTGEQVSSPVRHTLGGWRTARAN